MAAKVLKADFQHYDNVNYNNYLKKESPTLKKAESVQERRIKVQEVKDSYLADIASIESHSSETLKEVLKIIRPWEWLCDPVFIGIQNIPIERPALFVANHTIMAVFDTLCLWKKLFENNKIALRILADHYHYKIPYWKDFLYRLGVVEGTRANCSYLMEHKKNLLVFPGGAREAFKLKGEKYNLFWKHRTGFARMAIEHQYPIIPISSVGPEECYDILVDNHEIYNSPLGKLFKTIGYRQESIFPIVKGIGPTLIPKPQKIYLKFGKPIETSSLNGECNNIQNCMGIFNETKDEVQKGINELLLLRSSEPPDLKITKRLKEKLFDYSLDYLIKFFSK
ncbi:MAG: acyltransferase family protein [Oligoflexia bacterium]|nr:acyltransferase family protein [Oligoflexia bacterium]